MKKIMICALLLISVITMSVSVAAAPLYTVDYASYVVTVSGAVDVEEGAEELVALHVLNPDKTYENCDPNDFANVAYAGQTKTVGGEYSFSFKLSDTGIYRAYVGDGAKRHELLINFVNYGENYDAIEDLNDAAKVSYDEFVKILEENQKALGFSNLPLYDEVNQSTVLNRLYSAVKADALDPEKGSEAVELFESTVVIVGLNEKKVDDIADYAGSMSIATGEMKDWYTNPIVDSKITEAVTSRISGQSIDDKEEFDELFKEALILEIVANPNVAANAMKIMKEFADDIGIDTDGVKDNVYIKIAGNSYDDYADLRKAFNDAKKNTGGTGGSSGGSSGGGGGRVSLPATEKEPPVPVEPAGFDDLDGYEWAEKAILALADKKIVSYNSERRYYPDSMVKREEFVKLLVTMFGLEDNGSAIPFTDVKADDWFYPYVAAAYQNGLCRGVSETEFGSGLSVKRQDIAVLVTRAMESQGKVLENLREPLVFTDAADIDDYAVESVNSLCSAMILNGNPGGDFLPHNGATRAEAAMIIYGLTDYTE